MQPAQGTGKPIHFVEKPLPVHAERRLFCCPRDAAKLQAGPDAYTEWNRPPPRALNRAKEVLMAARAYWQGQIRLALVSIPVEVYSATKSGAQISFNQIHEPSGSPRSRLAPAHGLSRLRPDRKASTGDELVR